MSNNKSPDGAPADVWIETVEHQDFIHNGTNPIPQGPTYFSFVTNQRVWVNVSTKPIENSAHYISNKKYLEALAHAEAMGEALKEYMRQSERLVSHVCDQNANKALEAFKKWKERNCGG